MARFILSGFKRDFSGTNFYKEHSKRINEIAGKIQKETKKIKVEDKIEYLFIPPRLETKLWKEYMSKAERIISQRQGGIGIAVLRVIFEDESLEAPLVRVDWNQNSALQIFYDGGGTSDTKIFRDEDVVFVGSGFWRRRMADSNDGNVSESGDIIIGGIYHYPTKLKIEVQRGKAVAFGEVMVHSIPKEYRGNLMVKVEAEGGAKLMETGVNLKVSGFYSGKTIPLKDNSCLFSAVGPGSYSVEVASNTFGSPRQSAAVACGQTTEVTIKAYRHRLIKLDWRFRRTNEPNNWLSGQKTMRTKEDWQPNEEWIDVRYPVIAFGDWIENTCRIRSVNGNLMYVDTDEPFEEMDFPLNFSPFSYQGRPVQEGDIFAWRCDDRRQKGNFLEALIRIWEITPVEMPEDQNSSVQEKKSD
jgi:hypothetical protein